MTERTQAMTDATAPAYAQEGSYVDWSSIFAGAVVATSIAFVFSTFGAALGLSLVSPYEGEGSAIAAAIAVGSWMLWTTLSSFMVGGYITGRMRRRIDGATADEIGMRDGIHGLTVWAVAVLIGAVLLGSTLQSTVGAAGDVAGSVTTAAANVVDGVDVVDADATDVQNAQTQAAAAAPSEAEVKEAAEVARKTSIIAAFVLAASLMLAGAAAYWAASVGGLHRDEGRVFARFGRWT